MATHNIQKRETSISLAGLKPAIPESDRQQTLALDRSATGPGNENQYYELISVTLSALQ